MDTKWAYFYGCLLGDGHINYTKRAKESGKGPMLMMKVADYDFIKRWRDCITDITGFEYAISKSSPSGFGKRMMYKVRCSKRWLVDKAENETNHKSKIPDSVRNGSDEVKKECLIGLMDSEGWINMYLSSLSMCDITLGFACADDFFGDVYRMFAELGIKTSKVYKRKPVRKKDGTLAKPIRLFRIDIHDYINAGMGFSIKRKADRLAFISGILNDYTQSYPKYKDYYFGKMT